MATEETWLQQFTRASLGAFTLTPRVERRLSRRALAARNAPAKRDALFVDLSALVAARVARYRNWDLAPWEFDDVLQESYLVFVDIHTLWVERVRIAPSGAFDPGFGHTLLRLFPVRLSDRIDDLRGVPHANLTSTSSDDDRPDHDALEPDQQARLLVDAICARLRPRDAITFRLMVASDFSIRAVARQTGENVRTLYHRWERISTTARTVVLAGLTDVAA